MKTTLKRYLLFTYCTYYPSGGWSDFVESFDTAKEADRRAKSDHAEHWDIIDLTTGKHA